jgi:molybdopterin/thiamine biosynthesis adenylyltransferase
LGVAMAARVTEVEKKLHRDYSRLDATIFSRERVSNLRVMVVGAGALGNEVIKNLSLLGVNTLCIVDRDVIEPSNLTRSILFCVPEISEVIEAKTPKAEFAARRVRQINDEVRAVPIVGEIADVGLGLIRRMDLVFGCVDNEFARLELGWACRRTNRLLIDGGLGTRNYSSGLVSVFPGSGGPCYGCRKGRQRRREMLQELQGLEDPCWMKERRNEDLGVMSTTPLMTSVVAGIQVEFGLRHFLAAASMDLGQGTSIRINLSPEPLVERTSFSVSPECPLHESQIENVISVPGNSSELAVRDLLAAGTGGNASEGVLSMDWPITTEAECNSCHHSWQPFVRKARFNRSGRRCPACSSVDVFERRNISSVDLSSPLASKTLAALGLPPCHVHEVFSDETQTSSYIEVSGDREHGELSIVWA